MKLSVVLVNYNGRDCIQSSLAALKAHTATSAFEVIVVDSGSTDGSWRAIEGRYDNVRVIRYEDNIGFCSGCNRGAEVAFGEYLAFVNFDGAVETAWDLPLLEALTDPAVTVAGGMLLNADGTTVEALGLGVAINMATYGLLEGAVRAEIVPTRQKVAAVSGALMMMRREMFIVHGGFNEALWMYGDEIDLCLRMGGDTVVDSRSAIRHEMGHAAGPSLSPLRTYWSSRNRLINASRHLPPGPLMKAVVTSLAFDLIAVATTRRRASAGAAIRGWGQGIRLMGHERTSRSTQERAVAAKSVATFRETVHQYRTVRRNRSS